MIGGLKPNSLMITTSPHLSPEVLSATTVTAPVSSSVLHHHHHHDNNVTSQDADKLKRKKGKAKKQQDDVLFCNFPNHEGLVSIDDHTNKASRYCFCGCCYNSLTVPFTERSNENDCFNPKLITFTKSKA